MCYAQVQKGTHNFSQFTHIQKSEIQADFYC
jgi:hypothetical protein